LLPKFIGRGFGGALLTSAIEKAWQMSPSITRVWVHTCTLDHPRALANYQARGMVIYKREAAES
jgi:GNAT superfamily N-acetyltransferase